jgi:hypothetical protein
MTIYTITLSNGTTLSTLEPQVVDTSHASVSLIGQGSANYGQYLNNDLVHMVENFANLTAPAHPLIGQLWYDTGFGIFRVYNGTSWVALRPDVASNAGLTTTLIGGVSPSVIALISNGKIISTISDRSVAQVALPTNIQFQDTTYPFSSRFGLGLGPGITVSNDVELSSNDDSNTLVTSNWVRSQGYATVSTEGPTGPTGPVSVIPGPTGPMGATGASITGPTGPAGSGSAGGTGPTGPAGASVTGPTGPAGASITGPTGPAGPSQALIYVLNTYTDTTLSSSQIIGMLRLPKAVVFPANFGATTNGAITVGGSLIAATGTTTFNVQKCLATNTPTNPSNWATIGTAVYAPSDYIPTFTTNGGFTQSFALNDFIRIIGPTVADGTLAKFTFSLIGNLS